MSDRRRTYSGNDGGNNIGIVADFVIHISKSESNPASMITVDGDPEPLLKAFRRCLAKSTEDNKINICYLDDSNSNFYENGEAAVLTGAEGDVMVYFPEFFYKGTDTGSEWVFNITTTQVNKDNYEEQGWHHAPASLVGVYKGYVNSNKLYSWSEVRRTSNISMSNFSTYARNRGTGYHLIDYQQHCIIAWMFYAKYKNTNCQDICGYGKNVDSGIKSGTTNTLGITDTTPSNAGPYSNKLVNFLGIEGCWGHAFEWIEGIHSYSGVIAYDKGDFHGQPYSSITSPTKRILRKTSEGSYIGWISRIKGEEYMDIIGTYYLKGSSTTYFCDYTDINPLTSSYIFCRSCNGSTSDGGVSYLRGGKDDPDYLNLVDATSRLAFDGEITVIESPTTFKAITGFR